MQGVHEKAGGLMQLNFSYKLQVMRRRPVFISLPGAFIEQDLTGIVTQRWGAGVGEVLIPFSIQLNDTIKEMFDTAQPGDSFDVKVVVKCDYPGYTGLPSYEKSYPESPYVYIPGF